MSAIQIDSMECVWPAGRLLGEGVWWSAQEEAVYWVDIKDPAILRYRPADGTKTIWPMPEPIGCCCPRNGGGFVAAFQSGIYRLDLGAPGSEPKRILLAAPPGHLASDRFNDGAVHPDGSFWAGTMDDAEREVRGYFYRLEGAGKLHREAGPFQVCNGPAFSADGTTGYFTDSATRTIYRRLFDAPQADIHPFVRLTEDDGYPDGMTVDTEGRLWVACWDGAKVLCFAPSGAPIGEIRLPVQRPTRCAFGGNDLNELYVSSASIGISAEDRRMQPLAGGLFVVRLDNAKGFLASAFNG